MYKATHVLISAFYRDNRGVSETFARPFGVSEKIPSSWGRPKASDENPTGTGNGNPLDQAERLIRLVHAHDPARAREMVENFAAFVDRLDSDSGIENLTQSGSINKLLARSICEHSEAAAALIDGELTPTSAQVALNELRQAEVATEQLKAAVQHVATGGEK